MEELNKYLDKFSRIIGDLSDKNDNVRLGGTLVLKLHGLNFSRPVGDLDVIIVNPTASQRLYLKNLEFFQCDESYSGQHNFKFKKDNLYLNILLAEIPNLKMEPVFYKHKDVYYKIISINEIIDAKRKYKRTKDLQDFLLLKNENFNQ
jgi:hypothetical protein